jgi:ankyrin repeat protein
MQNKYVEIGYQSDLMKACWTKDIEQVRKLLAENPDSLWQIEEDGDTVLHFAARRRDIAIFQLLLDRGADVYAVNKSGETVFHIAAASNNYDLVKYLLDKNCFTADSLTATGEAESVEMHETKIVFNKNLKRCILAHFKLPLAINNSRKIYIFIVCVIFYFLSIYKFYHI